MYKLLLLILLISSSVGFSQNDSPLIERKGNLVLNRYYILGEEVSERQVLKKMKPYEAAHKRMKASRRLAFTSEIIAAIGAGSFFPSVIDPSPEITIPLLITGVSLIAIAVPIKKKANRKADEAIELYNGRKLIGEKSSRTELNLAITTTGLGIELKF